MFKFAKGYSVNSNDYMYFEVVQDLRKGYITEEDFLITNNRDVQVYKNSDFIKFEEIFTDTHNKIFTQEDKDEWTINNNNGNLIILDKETFEYIKEELENHPNLKKSIDEAFKGNDGSFDRGFDDLMNSMEEVDYLEFKDPITNKVEQFIVGEVISVENVELARNHQFNQYIEQLERVDEVFGKMELSTVIDVNTGDFYVLGTAEGLEGGICLDEDFIKDRLKEKEFVKDDPVDTHKQSYNEMFTERDELVNTANFDNKENEEATISEEDVELSEIHKFSNYIDELERNDDVFGGMDLNIVKDVDTGELYLCASVDGVEGQLHLDEEFINSRIQEITISKEETEISFDKQDFEREVLVNTEDYTKEEEEVINYEPEFELEF